MNNATAATGTDFTVRRTWIVWSITAAISTTIVALIIAAPLSQAALHPQLAAAIYKAFSFVCHQIPDRSFHVAGNQFAVCSRCTGLYLGFAAALLVYPMVLSVKNIDAPRRVWLFLAALPLAIDFALGYFAIWPNTHLSRFLTGALLGSVAVFYIMPGLLELMSNAGRARTRGGGDRIKIQPE
jgi:uncharacterized membrane protein